MIAGKAIRLSSTPVVHHPNPCRPGGTGEDGGVGNR